MTPRFRLKRTLKKAMKDIEEYDAINSPEFHIKSRNPKLRPIIYRPSYKDVNPTANTRQICNEYDAEEVLSIANTLIHPMNDETRPPQEAIVVMLEREDKIFKVIQPYEIDCAGNIKFVKKHWETRNKACPMRDFEGLVQ